MAFSDSISDVLQELEDPEDLNSISFRWNGNDYPGFATKVAYNQLLGAAGYAAQDDVTILCRSNLFGDKGPSSGHKIILAGRAHTIKQTDRGASGAFLRLVCKATTLGV